MPSFQARVTHGYMDTLRILGTFGIRIPDTWYFWYTDTGYLVPMVSAKYPCLRILLTFCFCGASTRGDVVFSTMVSFFYLHHSRLLSTHSHSDGLHRIRSHTHADHHLNQSRQIGDSRDSPGSSLSRSEITRVDPTFTAAGRGAGGGGFGTTPGRCIDAAPGAWLKSNPRIAKMRVGSLSAVSTMCQSTEATCLHGSSNLRGALPNARMPGPSVFNLSVSGRPGPLEAASE